MSNDQKTVDLEVKVTIEEMRRIGEYCRERGVNFSEWIRDLALREIGKTRTDQPAGETKK